MTQAGSVGNTRYRIGAASASSHETRPPPGTPGGTPSGAAKAKGEGKNKAAPNLRKQATSKLSQISSKLTESRVMGNESD